MTTAAETRPAHYTLPDLAGAAPGENVHWHEFKLDLIPGARLTTSPALVTCPGCRAWLLARRIA